MTPVPDDQLRDELQPVIDLLSAHRPEATALELDATKQLVLARAARPEKPRSGFMRSRAAILCTLVFGFLFSTAGAGLAVSGFAGNDQASVAQYPETATPTPGPETTPAPTSDQGAVAGEENTGAPDQPVLPAAQSTPDVQPDRQVVAGVQAADESELPFTGFAAIPVLLIGLALVSGGLVMRRSARND